jgi:hypothetical protein
MNTLAFLSVITAYFGKCGNMRGLKLEDGAGALKSLRDPVEKPVKGVQTEEDGGEFQEHAGFGGHCFLYSSY